MVKTSTAACFGSTKHANAKRAVPADPADRDPAAVAMVEVAAAAIAAAVVLPAGVATVAAVAAIAAVVLPAAVVRPVVVDSAARPAAASADRLVPVVAHRAAIVEDVGGAAPRRNVNAAVVPTIARSAAVAVMTATASGESLRAVSN